MMQIVVCFKIIPNLDRVLDEDWENFSQSLNLGYAGMDFNCFDRSALEIGLKIKEQAAVQGEAVSCTALTVCESMPETLLSGLYAVGFDRVVCVPCEQREFRPRDTAELLAQAIRELGADLVLTGTAASMAETGMVPYFLAQKLDLPILSEVEKAVWSEGVLKTECRRTEGLIEKQVVLPLLCAIGNSPEVLRCATLRAQMKCRGKHPEQMECREKGEQVQPSLQRPETGRTCVMLDSEETDIACELMKVLGTSTQETMEGREEERTAVVQVHEALCVQPAGEYGEGYEELAEVYRRDTPRLVLLPDNQDGRVLAAKLAEEFHINCLFGGEILRLTEEKLTVQKRVCAANLLWTQECMLPVVMTQPPDLLDAWSGAKCLSLSGGNRPQWLIQERVVEAARPDGLKCAEVVIVCGSGMGSKAACDRVRELADRLGAGFGLTRPAALNLWGEPTEIVGQSGALLTPKCCLVLGAAGAGAFMVGIEKAGKIIAVNTDQDALIFKQADLGVRMDARALVEKLIEHQNIEGGNE